METFDLLESNVRTYCRSFPKVFVKGLDYRLFDEEGREYLDFFSGAGALNYGHNNPLLKRKLIEYLEQDGITHSLDMATVAKRNFLLRFHETILRPRGLDYKIQFAGPTGTNAVEAALKLARKVTGRTNVIYFTNAYHGMTLGSLAITCNPAKRAGAGVPLQHTTPMPFDGYLGKGQDSLAWIEAALEDRCSGVEPPAAVILETIQAEGGINVASLEWLQRLERLVRRLGAVLIVDDIQVGCGRTGTFFSFEPAGIRPDIVCLSKSISGLGLPMALVLINPEMDIWAPGEHNGTFRGNNLAFVTGAEALTYWEDDRFSRAIQNRGEMTRSRLQQIVERYPESAGDVRGRGLIQGIAFREPALAGEVARVAFRNGVVIETVGPRDEVLKLLPSLTIDEAGLNEGLNRIENSIVETLSRWERLGEHRPAVTLPGTELLAKHRGSSIEIAAL